MTKLIDQYEPRNLHKVLLLDEELLVLNDCQERKNQCPLRTSSHVGCPTQSSHPWTYAYRQRYTDPISYVYVCMHVCKCICVQVFVYICVYIFIL